MKLFIFILFLMCITRSKTANTNRPKNNDAFKKFLDDSVDGTPEEPANEELKDLQPQWERSGKFEGDIILTSEQKDWFFKDYANMRNAVLNASRLWPDKTVIYEINEEEFTPDQIEAIKEGINDIVTTSCVKFRVKNDDDENYISISGDPMKGCCSAVGFVGKGPQVLNLAPNNPGTGCFRHGTIVHEFLHAIGFYHMQSTHDRDNYVKINWDKIKQGAENNFNKYKNTQVTNLGTEYDYASVLHYSLYSFSIDGSKTIEPLKQTDEDIGQRDAMTDTDILKVNRLYQCPKKQYDIHDKDVKPIEGKEDENKEESEDRKNKKDEPKEEKPKDKEPEDEKPEDKEPKEDKPKDEEPKEDKPKDEEPKEDKPKNEDDEDSTLIQKSFLRNLIYKKPNLKKPSMKDVYGRKPLWFPKCFRYY